MMYLPNQLSWWGRVLEWVFPWKRHARERAWRENMKWVARKLREEENGGYR